MAEPLTIELEDGAGVQGFVDTYPLRVNSAISEYGNGGCSGVAKWLGIPYGHPKRWERIKSWPKWSGKRQCYEFGPKPMSTYHPLEKIWDDGFPERRDWVTESEEDCLTLNIFKPATVKNTDRVPVLVFHHGGGLHVGNAACIDHDPTELVRLSESRNTPVIVVTMNYRVNIFGCLAVPSSLGETISSNCTLHDQVSALNWVQTFIERFGGDPTNVTALGSSAGAASLVALLSRNLEHSPLRLLKRLCLHSGTIGSGRFLAARELHWEKLLIDFEITSDDPGSQLSALRALPAHKLREWSDLNAPPGNWAMVLETGPQSVFDKLPLERLRQGQIDPNVESVIIGNTADEGSVFGSLLKIATEQMYNFQASVLAADEQEAFRRLYPVPIGDISAVESSVSQVLGDRMFYAPVLYTSRLLKSVATKLESQRPLKVYSYVFNGTLPKVGDNGQLGSFHTAELGYLFNLLPLLEGDDKLVQDAHGLASQWLDFIHSGEVKELGKDSDLVTWDSYPSRAGRFYSNDTQGDEKRAFWMGVMDRELS